METSLRQRGLDTPSVGWFTEKNENIVKETIVAISDDHTLYAHWSINNYTLTFNFNNGGENDVKILEFNANIKYPENVKKEGYSFNGWDNNLTSIPSNNINITAQWIPNNYTVTFNESWGDNSQTTTKIVTFGSSYGDLPKPIRENFIFVGWFNEMNESVTDETNVTISDSHTLSARWIEKPLLKLSSFTELSEPMPINQTYAPTKHVEIIFNSKGITREEIEGIIRRYTDSRFVITAMGRGEDETRVIVKFVDVEAAQNFVRIVDNASKTDRERNLIKRVGFILLDTSFSPIQYVTKFIYLI